MFAEKFQFLACRHEAQHKDKERERLLTLTDKELVSELQNAAIFALYTQSKSDRKKLGNLLAVFQGRAKQDRLDQNPVFDMLAKLSESDLSDIEKVATAICNASSEKSSRAQASPKTPAATALQAG